MAERVEMLRMLRAVALAADEGVVAWSTFESLCSDLAENGVFDHDFIESFLVAG